MACSFLYIHIHSRQLTVEQLSGSLIPAHTQADGQKYYDQLVATTNCTAARNTLDCLRGVPYEALLASVNQTPDLFSYLGMSLLWSPSIDGDIVVRNPIESVSRGAYAKVCTNL
jgi:hypothetical protein